jgi:hypothetical protein
MRVLPSKTALYFKETKASAQGFTESNSTSSAIPPGGSSAVSLEVAELERHAQDWLFDGEYRNHSQATITGKRDVVKKLLWFFDSSECR